MRPTIALGTNGYRLRKKALLRKSLLDSVAANPSFVAPADEPRFKRIVMRLEEVTQ